MTIIRSNDSSAIAYRILIARHIAEFGAARERRAAKQRLEQYAILAGEGGE